MDPETAALRTGATNAAWITHEALASSDASDVMQGWLTYQGLLSTRMRELFGKGFALRVRQEWDIDSDANVSTRLGCADGPFRVREIEIWNGKQRAMFAQSYFPSFTLGQQPWLSKLGDASLGERLAVVPGVTRGPLEFKRLVTGDPLSRAANTAASVVWARRSVFSVDGAPLLVTEVFLPELERWKPS